MNAPMRQPRQSTLVVKPTPREITMGVIRGVAARHGLELRDLMDPGTHPEKLEARRDALRCVKTCRPHLTNDQIAELFRVDESVVRKAVS